MFLGEVVLLMLMVIPAGWLLMWPLSVNAGAVDGRSVWVTDRVSLALVATFVAVMAIRSHQFGIDTVAYVQIFEAYCADMDIGDAGFTFRTTAAAWNILMFGACDSRFLPVIWVALMVGVVMGATRAPAAFKLRFLALFLMSMVGIELTTNTLRQGLAVALLIAAVSFWPKRTRVVLPLVIVATLMHGGTLLIAFGFAIATFRWPLFVLSALAGIGVTIWILITGVDPMFLAPFIYEIDKYIGHAADEFWIRLLAVATLLVAFLAPAVAAQGAAERKALFASSDWRTAVKFSLTCVPFLVLPYFGYRYIYGIYPIALWLVLRATEERMNSANRVFYVTIALNTVLVMSWAVGSEYMNQVPLID